MTKDTLATAGIVTGIAAGVSKIAAETKNAVALPSVKQEDVLRHNEITQIQAAINALELKFSGNCCQANCCQTCQACQSVGCQSCQGQCNCDCNCSGCR